MRANARVSLIVVAAGRGERFGAASPKQYASLGGRPLLCATLESLVRARPFEAITVVIGAADGALYETMKAALDPEVAAQLGEPAIGGESRQDSVRAGLERQAASAPDIVLIHDGARPFPSPALVEGAVRAALEHGAAAPGAAVTDTIRRIDANGFGAGALDRLELRALQTPQAFRFALILDAHRAAAAAGAADFTDDTALVEWTGGRAFLFPGEAANIKITTPADLAAAQARLRIAASDVRVGQGFDVHAFAPGDRVQLGGVGIPHDRSLAGHSDADVALHAITDALLGAIGDGDIGAHFPPSDALWRGADSSLFLADAARRVRARGGFIAHVDATLVCETPKIGPHREAMRARIAEILAIPTERVAVKATTSERLGFTGRGEGIACLASATVRLPET